ncbi:MAG: hypothetical protein ACJA0E_000954 [Bermanella sp.]
MALKATVFKCELNISDMDRHYYQTHSLTIARHPSENDLRMMIRIIAFALNAHDQLQFTKGLSSQDEPDLWNKSLSDEIDLWVDLGQVDEKRLRKACGKGKEVIIYTYNDKQAGPWETLMQTYFNRHNNLSVYHVPSAVGEELGTLVQKNMELQISIQDNEVFINSDTAQVNFTPVKNFPI